MVKKMNKKDIVKLANGSSYIIVELLEHEGNTYLYSTLLDKNNNAIKNKNIIFKYIKSNTGDYVEPIISEKLLTELLIKIKKY